VLHGSLLGCSRNRKKGPTQRGGEKSSPARVCGPNASLEEEGFEKGRKKRPAKAAPSGRSPSDLDIDSSKHCPRESVVKKATRGMTFRGEGVEARPAPWYSAGRQEARTTLEDGSKGLKNLGGQGAVSPQELCPTKGQGLRRN